MMDKVSGAVRARLKNTPLAGAILKAEARKEFSPVIYSDAHREALASASPRPSGSFGDFGFVNPPSKDVSVIVPVYNVEQYVGACLDSILGQDVNFDMEVIVINDGSNDGSLSEVKRRASSDSRVVLIDQENKGFSGARNVGIDSAGGGCCVLSTPTTCLRLATFSRSGTRFLLPTLTSSQQTGRR